MDWNLSSFDEGSRIKRFAADNRSRLRRIFLGSRPRVRDNRATLIGPWSERNDNTMKSRTCMPWLISNDASDSSLDIKCSADRPEIESAFLCGSNIIKCLLRVSSLLTRRRPANGSIFLAREWLDQRLDNKYACCSTGEILSITAHA